MKEDYALFLLEKKIKTKKEGKSLKQDWGGGLKEYIEYLYFFRLTKKALEWRGD